MSIEDSLPGTLMISIYDHKASFYHTPMFFQNVAVALRQLRAQLKLDKDSILTMYPDDFSVVQLAQFYPDTANRDSPAVFAHSPPIHICSISDLFEKDE